MADVNLSNAATRSAIFGYLQEDTTVHELSNHVNREAEFFGFVKKSSSEVRGKYAVIPAILKGNRNAVGSRGELDEIPVPEFQQGPTDGSGRVQGQVLMKHHAARMAITEVAIQASSTGQASFANAMRVEMEGLAEDMGDMLERQHCSQDGTGTVCVLSAAPSGTNLSVEKPGGQVCYPTGQDPYGALYLEVDDTIAVYSSAGVYRGTTYITAIDRTSTPNVLTVNAVPGSTASGDLIVRGSSKTASAGDDDGYNNEVSGIPAFVDDSSTFAGIDPTTAGNERFASHIIDYSASPQSLSEPVLQQLEAQLRMKSGRKSSRAYWTTVALELDYAQNLVPDKRFNNTLELKGGYTYLTHNNKPIMTSRYWLPGHWHMLDMDRVTCYNQGGFYWMDRDSKMSRIPNKMGYEATLLFFSQFGTDVRNTHGAIKGLKQPYAVNPN